MSPTAADNAVITIATNPVAVNVATAQRSWDVKVSQITCFASYRAPPGCDRYFTTDIGKITSYNFFRVPGTTPAAQAAAAGANTGLELASQRVNTCIRRSKGMCCVQYQVCNSFQNQALADTAQVGAANMGLGNGATTMRANDGWSIDINTMPYAIDATQVNIGMVDSMCTGDYVEIPSSYSGTCGPRQGSGRSTINTRYCGSKFGANFQQSTLMTSSTPVCDCTEPFTVRHYSDTLNDLANANVAPAIHAGNAIARGFCLDFAQTPCQ